MRISPTASQGRTMPGPLQHVKALRMAHDSRYAPPRYVEYAYYASVVYGILGSALGLSIAMLGIGMLGVLAVLCVMYLGSRATIVYAPLAFPLGCALSFVVLQLAVHRVSLTDDAIRGFIVWMPALVVVQALVLRRGFLHRFALVAFVTGLALLPYLHVSTHASSVKYQRVGLEGGVTLANPNNLAAWFGFCAVYCIIVGIETRRNVIRVVSWLIAVGCLYVVGITVSRGTLLAVAIATIVALRRLLKRGFLPALCLAILSWIIYTLGLFDQVGAFYAARGTEETGRLVIWPLVFDRFLNAPLTGVGLARVMTYLPGRVGITPHNHFLFIALVSGIIPLACYMAYWWRAAQGAFRTYSTRTADAPFCLPLVLYAFLIGNTTNMILDPWVIVTLSLATAAGTPRRMRRMIIRQIRRGTTAAHTEFWHEAGYGRARDQRFVCPASS